jgi:hypothetical protein
MLTRVLLHVIEPPQRIDCAMDCVADLRHEALNYMQHALIFRIDAIYDPRIAQGARIVWLAATGRIERRSVQGYRDGAVVSLGALGVVSSVTLETVAAFDLRQYVFDDVPWEAAEERLLATLAVGYSTSLFLSWAGETIEHA